MKRQYPEKGVRFLLVYRQRHLWKYGDASTGDVQCIGGVKEGEGAGSFSQMMRGRKYVTYIQVSISTVSLSLKEGLV